MCVDTSNLLKIRMKFYLVNNEPIDLHGQASNQNKKFFLAVYDSHELIGIGNDTAESQAKFQEALGKTFSGTR